MVGALAATANNSSGSSSSGGGDDGGDDDDDDDDRGRKFIVAGPGGQKNADRARAHAHSRDATGNNH